MTAESGGDQRRREQVAGPTMSMNEISGGRRSFNEVIEQLEKLEQGKV